ncbi:leucine-rich repeat domain-containing protein [Paenibacillus tundrae]|uniref:leucine-rich repeat domain-containing protein n=1 Tax=Paenibacillus tundrae TaxID=528187 RepID=UPI0030CC99B4
MTTVSLYTDPRETTYDQIIDELIEKTDRFLIVDRGYAIDDPPKRVAQVLEQLEPYLIEVFTMDEAMVRERFMHNNKIDSHAMYSSGSYYIYSCTPESGQVLKQEATRFGDWLYPSLPDDLCFLKEDGSDYFYTVAHEGMYGMGITEEEASELMERIPGLFFKLQRHEQFDCFLNDAIQHQTDRLNITGYLLSEIPDRIRELTQLKELEVFEQHVSELPPAFFELSALEKLTIMTADLKGIPHEIGKLTQLKELTIYGGSAFHVEPGWKPKPKHEMELSHLPAEIGNLRELVSLSIGYSGIRELPPELENLKKLKWLNITNSLIEGTPDIVSRMHWLEHVSLSGHSLGLSEEALLTEEEIE